MRVLTEHEERERSWERRLQLALRRCAEVDLVGVVSPSGAFGTQARWAVLPTLRFDFVAWRDSAGVVRRDVLRVRANVAEAELRPLMERVRPSEVLHVRARVLEAGMPDENGDEKAGPQAWLMRVVRPAEGDGELSAVAEELRRPVTVEDARFGTLTLDRRMDWFAGAAAWCGKPVRVHLDLHGGAGVRDVLARAGELWAEEATWNARVEAFAVERLLPEWREGWNVDGETRTPEEFLGAMRLESITVAADGAFSFGYEDGDLFGGHEVVVMGSLEGGVRGVELVG